MIIETEVSFFFSFPLIPSHLLTQSHPLSGNSYVSNTASRMSGITIRRERLGPTYQDYNAIKRCTVYVTAYLAKKAARFGRWIMTLPWEKLISTSTKKQQNEIKSNKIFLSNKNKILNNLKHPKIWVFS